MRGFVLVVTASVALHGCGSKDHARLERVAESANPTIVKLRPLVATVLANGGDLKAKNKACLDAIAMARGLKEAGFDDSYGPKSDRIGVEDVLLSFEVDASVDCADAKKGGADDDCQEWCAKVFRLLNDRLHRFAERARTQGVTIQSLASPTPDHE